MGNILEKVRQRDADEGKASAQAMYLAESRAQAEAAFRRFRARWQREYGTMVRRLERDLPELLSFFAFPRHLWRKLRTTNVIERCFVEVRRRTRPMVCFVNVESVDRIITPSSRDSIWNGKPGSDAMLTHYRKPAPSPYLHKQLDVTRSAPTSLTLLHRAVMIFLRGGAVW